MPNNRLKMTKISTFRWRRNVAIFVATLTALIVLGVLAAFAILNPGEDPVEAVTAIVEDTNTTVVTEVQESTDTENTPEKAAEFLNSYYSALANRDSAKLYDLGCDAAAAAIDLGWLDVIGWNLDTSKLGTVNSSSFPSSQGIYAGCTLYAISDFYNDSTGVISSDVLGNTELVGWVYYDALNVKWKIADPSLPTAISRSQAKNVTRSSSDSQVTVSMSTDGVYANAWWSYSKIDMTINNNSSSNVSVSKKSLDNGMTVDLGTLRTSIGSGSTSRGSLVVYRGTLSNFGIDKIGSAALSIDGNLTPVSIAYGSEDIAPVFAVGKADSNELQNEIAANQISRYNATNATVETPEVLNSATNQQ